MAGKYYWVGGSGRWSEISHWATSSGGNTFHPVVPGPTDTVYFDANSGFSPGNNQIIINTGATCHTMIWDGAEANPRLVGEYRQSLTIFGSLDLQEEMDINFRSAYFELYFRANQPGNTITTRGNDLSAGWISQDSLWIWGGIYFNGPGEWTLQDDLFAGYSILHLQQGSLKTGGHDLFLYRFSSSTHASKELHLEDSRMHLLHRFSVWGTGLTIFPGTSSVLFSERFQYNDFYVETIGIELHKVSFLNPDAISVYFQANQAAIDHALFKGNATVGGNNTFGTLELSPGKTYEFQASFTQTVTGSLLAESPTCSPPIVLNSNDYGRQARIRKTSGTVEVRNLAMRDIRVEGGATFQAYETLDLGNNDGWHLIDAPTPRTFYWIGGGGQWGDGSHWSLTSGGPPANCVPTGADDIVFDGGSGFTANDVVVIEAPAFCHNMLWDGAPGNPTIKGKTGQSMNITGSMTLQGNMQVDISQLDFNWNFHSQRNDNTITSNNRVLQAGNVDSRGNYIGRVQFYGEGGGWTFLDTFRTGDAPIFYKEGEFLTNDQSIYCYSFLSDLAMPRKLRLTGSAIHVKRNVSINCGQLDLDAGTSTFYFNELTPEHDFFGGTANLLYHNVYFLNPEIPEARVWGRARFNRVFFAGNGEIFDSNTYTELEFSPGKVYKLGNGTTQAITGDLLASSPICDPPITITSMTTGAHASISKSNGEIRCENLVIGDLHGVGGADFIAESSISLGNTDGWQITEPGGREMFWIGGAGNWGDGSNWSFESGGNPANCVPTANDDVFFDENSNFSAGDSVVINTPSYCRNMTWQNAGGNPLLLGVETKSLNIFGSLLLQEAMQVDFKYVHFTVNFRSNEMGNIIRTNGNRLEAGYYNWQNVFRGGVYFDGKGGEWTLEDDLAIGISYLYHLNGTLITNDQSLSAFQFYSHFNGVRALKLGASDILISSRMQFTDQNLDLDAGTSTIRFSTNNSHHTFIINIAGLKFYNVEFANPNNILSNLSGNNTEFNEVVFRGNGEIYSSNTFGGLKLGPGKQYALQAGSTQYITNLLEARGNPCFVTSLQSTSSGNPARINSSAADPIVVDFINMKDIHAQGGADFIGAENANNLGNNTGWDFSARPEAYIFGFGPERILDCDAIPYTITTENFNPNPGTTFVWSDGSTGSELVVNEFGTYTVVVHYADFCSISDEVVLIEPEMPEVDLGPDRSLVTGEEITLDAGPGENITYLWSTGDTTQTIVVSQTGTYWVEVTNQYKCTAYDEVVVSSGPQVVTAEPEDITFFAAVLGGEVTFDGGIEVTDRGVYYGTGTDPAIDGLQVEMGAGLGEFSGLVEGLTPDTQYYVVAYAINSEGTAFGEVLPFITPPYEVDFFIPNAFMPDSHLEENRTFHVTFRDMPGVFSMEIFNRWGERIFHTDDAQSGWDGRKGSDNAPQGSYAYRIAFRFHDEPEETHFGVLMLIR